MCQTAGEKRERERAADIGVSGLQKRSIGNVSHILVSIHIEIFIFFDNTNADFTQVVFLIASKGLFTLIPNIFHRNSSQIIY